MALGLPNYANWTWHFPGSATWKKHERRASRARDTQWCSWQYERRYDCDFCTAKAIIRYMGVGGVEHFFSMIYGIILPID